MDGNNGKIAGLIAALDHADKPAIRAAVDELIALAQESLSLRELLEHRLAESGHRNYWPVAYVLGHLEPPSGACIEKLIDALDHAQPDIRWAISLLLARMAGNHPALIDSLIRLCETGSTNQRRMALYCLRDLHLGDAASCVALLAALRDAEPSVRVAAAICLKARPDLDEAGKNILLETYCEDAEPKVRHAAAIALANLGRPAEKFLTALRKNSESKNEQTKKAALAALALLEKRRSASGGSASDR